MHATFPRTPQTETRQAHFNHCNAQIGTTPAPGLFELEKSQWLYLNLSGAIGIICLAKFEFLSPMRLANFVDDIGDPRFIFE
jgi:hypothetical protein